MYDAATLMCIKMYNYNAPINEYIKKMDNEIPTNEKPLLYGVIKILYYHPMFIFKKYL